MRNWFVNAFFFGPVFRRVLPSGLCQFGGTGRTNCHESGVRKAAGASPGGAHWSYGSSTSTPPENVFKGICSGYLSGKFSTRYWPLAGSYT
jgi:hypothetical protein